MPDGATRERKHRLHHLLAVDVAAGLNHACHAYEEEMSHARAVLPGQRNADLRGRVLSRTRPTCAPPLQAHETGGKMRFYGYEFEGAGSELP
jgi:hypothetical protein